MEQQKKGLVLAGGGAKGSYQIGVWQALCELDWRPDIITGTSIGSLNGTMFALDAAETARAMWLQIRSQDIMELPQGDETPTELHRFLREVVREGGLDVSPLEEIVDLVLDETALRNSPIAFGLVTVEMFGLRRKQLALSDIPEGKVKEYLLASAACFPAFRPREIDGTLYLDGGYQDVMPHQLAIEMGAAELVCVDLDAIGITRKNPLKQQTILIESHWDLGPILQLDPERSARNITLGYHDTLRAFGKLRGTAYGILPSVTEKEIAQFQVNYTRLLIAAVKRNPALAVLAPAAMANFRPTDKPLAVLELAAKTVAVPPTQLYTFAELCDAFVAAYTEATKEDDPAPLRSAVTLATHLSGRKADDFVAMLVFYALTQPIVEQEVLEDERI